MSGFLVDANVLLDVATADAKWMPWSQGQLAAAAGRGPVFINPIIYAEVEKLTLITRDMARYRTYFPAVGLVSP